MQLTINIDDAVVAAYQRLIDAHGWRITVVEYFAAEVNRRNREVVSDYPETVLQDQLEDLDRQKKTAVDTAVPSVVLTPVE